MKIEIIFEKEGGTSFSSVYDSLDGTVFSAFKFGLISFLSQLENYAVTKINLTGIATDNYFENVKDILEIIKNHGYTIQQELNVVSSPQDLFERLSTKVGELEMLGQSAAVNHHPAALPSAVTEDADADDDAQNAMNDDDSQNTTNDVGDWYVDEDVTDNSKLGA